VNKPSLLNTEESYITHDWQAGDCFVRLTTAMIHDSIARADKRNTERVLTEILDA